MEESKEKEQHDLLKGKENGQTQEKTKEKEQNKNQEEKQERLYANKYKNVEELEKGYIELNKLLSSRRQAPEKYELDQVEGLTPDEELIKQFKEAGLDNKQANSVLKLIAAKVVPTTQAAARITNELLTRAKLGFTPDDDTYHVFIEELKNWAEKNVPESALKVLRTSPDGIQALHQMRQAAINGSRTTVLQAQPQQTKNAEIEEIKKLIRDPKYLRDANYRDEVNKRLTKIMTET